MLEAGWKGSKCIKDTMATMQAFENVRDHLQVFIRGGNYIATDWMLRWSAQRYRDDVRMHAEVHASTFLPALKISVILTLDCPILSNFPKETQTSSLPVLSVPLTMVKIRRVSRHAVIPLLS